MSRTQLRANSGAASTDKKGETDGEICEVAVAVKTQTTSAGTGDTI